MIKLTFNQKVFLGFAIIILLLLTSGLSSLWNLNDINKSTNAVNEIAVPVVNESNSAQIQLLKLAKLSSTAFSELEREKIVEYRNEFENDTIRFDEIYAELKKLTANDEAKYELWTAIGWNYEVYRDNVAAMFDAKIGLIDSREAMLEEAGVLMELADMVGGSLIEIQYYEAPEGREKDMELIAGQATQADVNALNVLKTVEEIKITQDMDRLGNGMDDFAFALEDSQRWFDKAKEIFAPFDEDGLIEPVDQAYADLFAQFEVSPSMVDHKLKELEQTALARVKLEEASKAVGGAISELDKLLGAADDQFKMLQGDVLSTLDFGFKMSIFMLIILIILAAQNFNSMRVAIRKKMIDLAKLNKIGGDLAAAQTQSVALEEVLQSMHEKMGVEQGSVFLMNDANQLEIKAHFPPKAIDPNQEPKKFKKGEGIIGKAAELKKAIFVEDTTKNKEFLNNADPDNARSLLCVPLIDKDILVGVINLSGEVGTVHFADSDYEFVETVARSLVTTVKNIRMREVIEEQNRNLEAKVEERTAELRQKNNDIANMMANMHQGLFTITPGGSIHPEYAKYLEEIFETDTVAGRHFADLLFTNATTGSDAVDQSKVAVDAIVGEDEMMFEFNSHCLLTEMTIEVDGKTKILEMDWDPIISEDDIVDKLMVTVRDVTEVKALELAAAEQKKELEIIGEILAVDAAKFGEFLTTSRDFIAGCREKIEATTEKDLDVIAMLFRNMHTVKGNARTYGLSNVTNVVHEVESTYDSLRKEEDSVWNQAQLIAELDEAEEIIERYGSVFTDKLGRDPSESAAGASIDHERVESWIEQVKGLDTTALNGDVVKVMEEAFSMLVASDAKGLDEVIKDVVDSAHSLADQLGKSRPIIDIDNGGIQIEANAHSMLNNIFMHVFRNAMDHGIESPDERVEKGKELNGRITLDTEVDADCATLTVRDDGRGIAITKIYEMAVEKGIYAAEDPRPSAVEIANLIFASGFSTAEAVTDVSGRGVGMDAVKGFLEDNGGSIAVTLDEGAEDAAFRTFATQIRLPAKFFTQAVEFALSA